MDFDLSDAWEKLMEAYEWEMEKRCKKEQEILLLENCLKSKDELIRMQTTRINDLQKRIEELNKNDTENRAA